MYTQGRCWACSSGIWERSVLDHNPKNEPPPPPQSFQILVLTVGFSDMPYTLKAEAMGKHQESPSDSSHAGEGSGYR